MRSVSNGNLFATLLCFGMLLVGCGRLPALGFGEIVQERYKNNWRGLFVTIKNKGTADWKYHSYGTEDVCISVEWFQKDLPKVILAQTIRCLSQDINAKQFIEVRLASSKDLDEYKNVMVKVSFTGGERSLFATTREKVMPSR